MSWRERIGAFPDRNNQKDTPPQQEHFDFEAYPIVNKQIAHQGNIPIIWGVYGEPETADNYIKRLKAEKRYTKDAEETVRKSGFREKYRYPGWAEPFTKEFQDNHIEKATEIALDVIKDRGWEDEEIVLNTASITSWNTLAIRVAEKLEEQGIKIKEAEVSNLACRGGIDPLIRYSSDENYRGAKVVSVTIDSIHGNFIDPEDHPMYWYFNNGVTGIGFIPGDEVEVISGTTLYKRNESAMRVPQPYSHDLSPGEIVDSRDGYEPENPESDGYLYHDPFGTHIPVAPSEDQFGHMHPGHSIKEFGPPMVKLIEEEYEKYNTHHKQKHGKVHSIPIHHNASLQVIKAQYKALLRNALIKAKVDRGAIGKLVKHKLSLGNAIRYLKKVGLLDNFEEPPRLTWTPNITKTGNISAGTSIIDWGVKAKLGLLPEEETIAIIGFGVGINKSVHFIKIHKSKRADTIDIDIKSEQEELLAA